jgi:thiol:disulfide interchange protein DsbD
VCVAAVLAGVLLPAQAAPQKPGFVQVELIAENTALTPGKPAWIGLSMKHDRDWHTYWKNPGDAGLPTTIQFTLPPGFKAGAIEWPYPQRIPVKQLASYGYSDEILLPLLLFVPRQIAQQQVTLKARADWLVCKESCIPEGADLQITLPLAQVPQASVHKPQFDAARAALPRPVAGASATAVRDGGRLQVRLNLPPALQTAGELFIEREDVIEPGPAPQLQLGGGAVNWSSALTTNGKSLPAPVTLKAVWVMAKPVPGQPQAVRLEINLQK